MVGRLGGSALVASERVTFFVSNLNVRSYTTLRALAPRTS
jgi:hypothetical protein